MPNYRRTYSSGSTVFLPCVTYNRLPLFAEALNVKRLRQAFEQAKNEAPFEIVAAAILPDHLHFIWTLPPNDSNYSKRIGRIKVLFTRSLKGQSLQETNLSPSRRKHRESNVWHRRFWEHTICDDEALAGYLDYIHYNPVKHGLVSCLHLWPHSSFHKWVRQGHYPHDWACQCGGEEARLNFSRITESVGE